MVSPGHAEMGKSQANQDKSVTPQMVVDKTIHPTVCSFNKYLSSVLVCQVLFLVLGGEKKENRQRFSAFM